MENKKKFYILLFAINFSTVALLGGSFLFFYPEFFTKNTLVNEEAICNFSANSRGPASSLPFEKNLTIPAGETYYLSKSLDVGTLTVNGTLKCDHQSIEAINEIKIRAKTIIVNGVFECGTESEPYAGNLTISLKHSFINPNEDPRYRGLVVNAGGVLSLHGLKAKAGWTRLARTAQVGDTSIYVVLPNKFTKKNLPSPQFSVGDKIVIAPTGYEPYETENFEIIGIDPQDPSHLYLNRPFNFVHWGELKKYNNTVQGNITFDERAEVANLTRNIKIQADEEDFLIDETDSPEAERGGHVMIHGAGYAYINSVEFYKMGQAGSMARYPFHWHYTFDATGQYIKNSSIHRSYQRCIVVHQTHNSLVQNNVCFDTKGHGIFLEDGNEVGNKILNNLVIKSIAPYPSKLLLASDDITNSEVQGRFPSVSNIWISNPDNHVEGNIAAGSVGTGIWMAFEKEIKDYQGNVIARPLTTATHIFNNNTAHSSQVGITWDGAPDGALVGNPNNPKDKKLVQAYYKPPVIPTFRGLKAYKNKLTGIYFRGYTVIFDRAIVADNGRSFWVTFNQIIKNSIFIGETQNQSSEMRDTYFTNNRTDRYRKSGIAIYDGPFEIHNSDFLDFSTSRQEYLINGSIVHTTVSPFSSIGGTKKYTNVTSGLRFRPEPIYRALLEDETNYKERTYLGNTRLRDLDGSLSSSLPNSYITGKRSLAVKPQDNCIPHEKFLNYLICPPHYTEATFYFYLAPDLWSIPFVVRRDDGAFSYPISEWNQMYHSVSNNSFSLANDKNTVYELLPKDQYIDDISNSRTPHVGFSSEKNIGEFPIVKLLAYGKNCRLVGENVTAASSLSALKNQNTNAYYTNGEDFYIRLLPMVKMPFITPNLISQASGYKDSLSSQRIECDNEEIEKRIIGKLESIERTRDNTTLHGWACNYSFSTPIMVRAYAKKMSLINDVTNMKKTKIPPPILLSQTYSNKNPDAEIAFKCGKMFSGGKRFSITIANSQLEGLKDYKFYIKGISNTNGQDMYISGSGVYDVIP